MPHVTFSSPSLPRSVKVFAAPGDHSSILDIANAHRIPLPQQCNGGECGECVVDVLALSGKMFGSELTEKEKARLESMGKITAEEIRRAEVDDVAPRFRLACQYIVLYEDILVMFSGQRRGARA
jgi:ferredoxin